MRHLLLVPVLLLGTFAAGPAARADEEAVGGGWRLKLDHGPLRIVELGQGARARTYHYAVLRVTNPTQLARPWVPLVKAWVDTDRTEPYVAAGFPEALEAVRRQERASDLVAVEASGGRIEPGQTLATVAIFGPLDPQYDEVKLEVFGLTDPIAIYRVEKYAEDAIVIRDPAYDDLNQKVLARVRLETGPEGALPEPTVEYHEVAEKRAYEIVYQRLGDEFRADDDLIEFVREGWKVVEPPKKLREIELS